MVEPLQSQGQKRCFLLETTGRGTFIEAVADRTSHQIAGRSVRVPGSTDPAENTDPGNAVCMALPEDFVPYPEDQNRGKKKGQIEADKPGKSDRNHGWDECCRVEDGDTETGAAPQSTRTLPHDIASAGSNLRAMIQIFAASSLTGSPEDSIRTT